MDAKTPVPPVRPPVPSFDDVTPVGVTPWSAELIDRKVEAEYLVDRLPEDRRRFLFVLFFFSLSLGLNLAGDLYAILHLGIDLGYGPVPQVVFLALTPYAAFLALRLQSPHALQWLTIVYVVIGVIATLTTIGLHPRLGIIWPTMMIGVVIVISFCLPLSFPKMAVLVLGYSLIAPLTWTLWAGPPSADEMYRTILRLLLANVLGLTVAHTLQRSQRIQFAQNRLLQRLLSTDALTGIANRRHFDRALHDEWRRCARAGIPLSLLMIDVDYFKAYNDHRGHVAGDDCLRRVAAILIEAGRRPGDLVARYGGEEFVCLLADTDAAGAVHVAERLQTAVAAANIAHPGSPHSSRLTISIGAATAHPPAGQRDMLVALADRALYAAKNKGRNTIVGDEMREAAPPLAHEMPVVSGG